MKETDMLHNSLPKIPADSLIIPNDISKLRQYNATLTTANYVEKNMSKILSVDAIYKVHDLAISCLDPALSGGLVLEFGVFQGGTINYIAKKLPERKIYGFDSFEGLPECWRDGFGEGTFKTENLPDVESNVELRKGLFDDSLKKFLKEIPDSSHIAYLHVDCDLYSSTKSIFNYLGNRIKNGTIIVFDEYFNYPGWMDGEFKAFHEFLSDSGFSYEYLTYNRLHEQVAIKIIGHHSAPNNIHFFDNFKAKLKRKVKKVLNR